MTTAAPTKFSPQRITTAPDKSAAKAIVTGDAGVGKTYFLSTIVAEDGRPIFIIPIEEGMKGASPLHSPAKFADGYNNAVLPQTFPELLTALRVFRMEVNFARPPLGWVASICPDPNDPEFAVMATLCDVNPLGLPIPVLSERSGIPTGTLAQVLERLGNKKWIRRDSRGLMFPVPDRATWRTPHVHLGVDSLSGAELLIHREVTGRANVSSMADKEYNALWQQALPLWQELRDELDLVRRAGTHVYLVAHAVADIDASHSSGEIYRALDLMFRGTNKTLIEIRQFWRQWADSVFYIVRDVSVTQGDKKKRSTAKFTGRRLITTETAQCRAKSRLALPPSLPATWIDLRDSMKRNASSTPEKLRARVLTLVPRLDGADQAGIMADLETYATNAQAIAAILSRVEGMVLVADDLRAELASQVGQEPAPADAGSASADDAAKPTTPTLPAGSTPTDEDDHDSEPAAPQGM